MRPGAGKGIRRRGWGLGGGGSGLRMGEINADHASSTSVSCRPELRTERRASEREKFEARRRGREALAEVERERQEEQARREEAEQLARLRLETVHKARPMPHYR